MNGQRVLPRARAGLGVWGTYFRICEHPGAIYNIIWGSRTSHEIVEEPAIIICCVSWAPWLGYLMLQIPIHIWVPMEQGYHHQILKIQARRNGGRSLGMYWKFHLSWEILDYKDSWRLLSEKPMEMYHEPINDLLVNHTLPSANPWLLLIHSQVQLAGTCGRWYGCVNLPFAFQNHSYWQCQPQWQKAEGENKRKYWKRGQLTWFAPMWLCVHMN